MFRYIIFAGNPDNPSDVHAMSEARARLIGSPDRWRSAVDTSGFYIGYVDDPNSPETAVRIHAQSGAVLGRAFGTPHTYATSSNAALHSFSRIQADRIARSEGRSLVSDVWGHYVAALHYPEKHETLVFRSPMSSLPCFQAKLGTFNIFFSCLRDYLGLRPAPLSINWDSIVAQVVGGDYLSQATAINEIRHLECGEAAECSSAGCSYRIYWDPRHLLADRSLLNFEDAVKDIRSAVDTGVNALSSGHANILVNLSGGLDSSIVLGAIQRSPHRPTVTAVTYYSGGPGDERRFARSMARSVNCRLLEYSRNEHLSLEAFRRCNLTVRPVLNISAADVEPRTAKLARELSATAVFNGELGDNIFGSAPSPGVLIDSIRQKGCGGDFLLDVQDYALLTRQSIWRALARARRESVEIRANGNFGGERSPRFQSRPRLDADSGFVSAAAEDQYAHIGDRFLHPWMQGSRELAPGAGRLLYGLIATTSPLYHSPFVDEAGPAQVSPLVTQPLAEVALRIPSYLHCTAGEDRAVARNAFKDALPTDILHRRTGKGGPDLWARAVVDNNVPFLREFLLDGVLVQRGLLDGARLENLLGRRLLKSTAMMSDIFITLYVEAWLRRFAQSPVL